MFVAVISTVAVGTTLVAVTMTMTMVMAVSFFVGMVVVTMRAVTMIAMVINCAKGNQGSQWSHNICAVIVVCLRRRDGHHEG